MARRAAGLPAGYHGRGYGGGLFGPSDPEQPYTSADLNYNTGCSANREQNAAGARPAISGGVENTAQYTAERIT